MNARLPFFFFLLTAGLLALPGGAFGQSKPAPAQAAAAPAQKVKLSVAKPGAGAIIVPEDPPMPVSADPALDPNLPGGGRPVRLYNLDGRYLEAKLLSVSGDLVTVERISDQRQFTIALETLDAPTMKRIDTWMNQDPQAIEFSLDISAKKRLVESDTFESQGRTLKRTDWVYDVELSNKSRNDLRDAQVEYRVLYDDKVELVKSIMYPGKGGGQRDGEALELPVMPFNGRAEFTTPAVEMQAYEFVPVKGAREIFRDEITGIWIRVLRKGRVIGEYQSNPASMHNLAWEEKGATQVEIRDSFEEQFDEKR